MAAKNHKEKEQARLAALVAKNPFMALWPREIAVLFGYGVKAVNRMIAWSYKVIDPPRSKPLMVCGKIIPADFRQWMIQNGEALSLEKWGSEEEE